MSRGQSNLARSSRVQAPLYFSTLVILPLGYPRRPLPVFWQATALSVWHFEVFVQVSGRGCGSGILLHPWAWVVPFFGVRFASTVFLESVCKYETIGLKDKLHKGSQHTVASAVN